MAARRTPSPRRSPPPPAAPTPKRRRADSPHLELDRHDVRAAPQDLTPVASLPSDLLVYVFAFSPLRPRLLVLSLVCKRWRHLLLNSITALPPICWATANLAPALGLFPRLTSLSLTALGRIDHPLPGRLRHLCMRRIASLSHTALVELTALTSLELADCAIGRREFVALFDPVRTALTSLSLNVFASANAPYLHATHFPRLVDLEISFSPVQFSATPHGMVIAHAEQLTRLSVASIRAVPEHVSFPRLVAFSVTYYDAQRLANFVSRHPRVTDLRLLRSFTLPAIDQHNAVHLAPALNTITLNSPQPEEDIRVLAPLTRLTRLRLPRQLIAFQYAPAALCAQLTALDVNFAYRASPPSVLSLFPNLTSLGFHAQALTDHTPAVSLPRLRSLTYRIREDTPLHLANFLRVFIEGCPSLTTLCFIDFNSESSWEEFVEFTTKLQQRGVTELTLMHVHLSVQAVRELRAANRWLWIRLLTEREVELMQSD